MTAKITKDNQVLIDNKNIKDYDSEFLEELLNNMGFFSFLSKREKTIYNAIDNELDERGKKQWTHKLHLHKF